MQLTSQDHLAKSGQNEQFAHDIATSTPAGVEWAITVKFYAALHFISACFAAKSGNQPLTHARRNTAIQQDALISGVYDDYRELQDLSREARYDYSNLQPGHVKFADDCLDAIKSRVRPHL